MPILRDIDQLFELLPAWLRIVLLIALLGFSALTIYERIDLDVGKKVFSRIERDHLRSNYRHIVQYTVLPTIGTAYYVHLYWNSLLSQ